MVEYDGRIFRIENDAIKLAFNLDGKVKFIRKTENLEPGEKVRLKEPNLGGYIYDFIDDLLKRGYTSPGGLISGDYVWADVRAGAFRVIAYETGALVANLFREDLALVLKLFERRAEVVYGYSREVVAYEEGNFLDEGAYLALTHKILVSSRYWGNIFAVDVSGSKLKIWEGEEGGTILTLDPNGCNINYVVAVGKLSENETNKFYEWFFNFVEKARNRFKPKEITRGVYYEFSFGRNWISYWKGVEEKFAVHIDGVKIEFADDQVKMQKPDRIYLQGETISGEANEYLGEVKAILDEILREKGTF